MGEGVFFFRLCFGVESGLSLFTFHLDSGQNAFPCKLGGGRGVFKAKSSQVLHMFPKKIPIAHHFYPICFGKTVLFSSKWMGQKEGTLYFKIKPFILGSLHSFMFLSDGLIKLAHYKKKHLNREEPHLMNRRGE